MKKLWFRRFLITVLLLEIFAFILFLSVQAATDTLIVNGSDFELYFSSGKSLSFQHLGTDYLDSFIVSVTVQSGTLNGTNSELTMYSRDGECTFTSQDNATLVPSEFMKIKVNDGKAKNEVTDIKVDDDVTFMWSGPIYEPLIPILFMIGLIGLAGMFAGPIYTIHKVKHGEYREAFVNGLVVTVIGLALFIAWLWS